MDVQREIKAIQAESEATKDLPLPEDVPGQRRGRSVVQSARLPEKEFAGIERLAGELDAPVSALIRGWVLTALAEERGTSLRGAIDRVAAEAERLRRIAHQNDVA